ncbi:MAG: hypothetical protein ACK5ND_05750 [Bacteroides sp.]
MNEQIYGMFYDCTTLYFESFIEDELLSFEYNKDHKFNQGQVLLALLVTEEDLPVRYDFWNAVRIYAYIAICCIAFCLIRYLQYILIQTGAEWMSAKK